VRCREVDLMEGREAMVSQDGACGEWWDEGIVIHCGGLVGLPLVGWVSMFSRKGW
jgi:hypothetical protein